MPEAHHRRPRPGRAPSWLAGLRWPAVLVGGILVIVAVSVIGVTRPGTSPRANDAASSVVTTSAPTTVAPSATAANPAGSASATTSASRTTPPAQRAPTGGGQSIRAFITGYSFFDNTPPGAATISNPVLHKRAGGTGSYADPITVAVGHAITGGKDVLDWPAGTRFYIPNLRRYFIAEDTCGDGPKPQDGACHTGYPSAASTWLDAWVGGEGGSSSGAGDCMNRITGVWDVIVKPPAGYAVVSGSVYASNGCTAQYGNELVPA